MLKRLVLLVVLLFVLPGFANATWYITARTSPTTGQGTITPSGTITMTSNTATQDFVVAPAAYYAVSRVTLDGANMTPKEGTTDTYTVSFKEGATYRNIVAYFIAASRYSITVSIGRNGSYRTDPAGQTLTGIPAGSSRTIVVTPALGYQFDSLTASGAVITDANDGTGAKKVAFTNIQANKTINATFKIIPAVIAKAGPDRTTQGNSAEFALPLNGSLSSSNMGPITYSWSVTGPGVGTISDAAAQQPTFYATTPGAYTVSLTITSGGIVSAPDTVVITVLRRTVYLEQLCSSCHSWRNPTYVTTYDASRHKAIDSPVVVCQTCHDPTNTTHYTVAKPFGACTPCHSTTTPQIVTDFQGSLHQSNGLICTTCHADHTFVASSSICQSCHSTVTPAVVSDYLKSQHATSATPTVGCYNCHATHEARTTFATCLSCHTSFPPNLTWHAGIPTNTCQNCHNPHYPENVGSASMGYPHFANFTTAQYCTTNITCPNCHVSAVDNSFHIYSANNEWARSGKADPKSPAWVRYDFKIRGAPAPASPANSVADDCVRCHTTTGYINYVTSNFTDIRSWGTSGLAPGGDRKREMITCNACHNNATGFDAAFSRRRVGIQVGTRPTNRQVWAYYGYSSAASGKNIIVNVFNNKGESNLCIACHTGKVLGQNIQDIAQVVGGVGNLLEQRKLYQPPLHGISGPSVPGCDNLMAGGL